MPFLISIARLGFALIEYSNVHLYCENVHGFDGYVDFHFHFGDDLGCGFDSEFFLRECVLSSTSLVSNTNRIHDEMGVRISDTYL